MLFSLSIYGCFVNKRAQNLALHIRFEILLLLVRYYQITVLLIVTKNTQEMDSCVTKIENVFT